MSVSNGRRAQPERDEQIALFRFLRAFAHKYPVLSWVHAVPNGLALHPRTAATAKATGTVSGVWDIFVPVPYGDDLHGLYLEMKAGKNTLTPEQKAFRTHAEASGYRCVVARSWVDAATAILDYLRIDDPALRRDLKG